MIKDNSITKFRKEKIAQEPKNDLEERIREEMIKRERGTDLKDFDQTAKERMREAYFETINVLKHYVDMDEDYYSIVSLWIIGTYFHKEFLSYPYLFFNAMRGSGKTKTMNLITTLSREGNLMASPTEAVLFRTDGTLAIDEFERVGSKEKATIRELLNACYKKGMKIFRMKKKKVEGQEEQVVEEFSPYRPLIMANISGMDEVLGDRCISLILEKSDNPRIVRLSENFDNNVTIKAIKELCSLCSKCSLCSQKNLYTKWDNYVNSKYENYMYITTLTTYNTLTTHNTHKTANNISVVDVDTAEVLEDMELMGFFNKIDASDIKGRNLELYFPLFLLAHTIGDIELTKAINTAKKLTKDKIKDEETESVDVMVFDYVSQLEINDFKPVKEHTAEFLKFTGEGEDYMNPKWFGHAIKRLALVKTKRRVYRGVEVILDVDKAKTKMQQFKKK
tara:strand:- start:1292 stop:2641 length:1350 start_codon:yes stop_codon:yes gene_type:complete